MGIVHTREDDIRVLWLLDMHDNRGMTLSEIAAAENVTRNVVVGLIHRVKREVAAARCVCRQPENRDGGMPRRWWVG